MATSNPNPTIASSNPTSTAPAAAPPVITSTTDPNVTRAKLHLETRDQTLVAGIVANLGDIDTFVLPGGPMTRDELVAALQSRIAAAEATKASKNGWHSTVQAERQAEADVQPLRKGMKQYLASRYGADSAKMAEFGFIPAKARKTSVRTKAGAIAKAAATRVARHTMGKVQKESISGQATPAAPVTPAGPASAAPTGAAK